MTRHERLALVLTGTDPNDAMGDEGPSLIDQLEASLFAAMTRRLKAQDERITALEQMEAQHRSAINRILTRFAVEGRPIPPEAA